jgi:hypothetical protein
MKKYNFGLIFLMLIIILYPTKVSAFAGKYRYDINAAIISNQTFTIYGWAVINGGSGNDTTIHNVNTRYTLDVYGADDDYTRRITGISTPLVNMNRIPYQPDFSGVNSQPRDYTKAFYVVQSETDFYPTGDGASRAAAISRTGNKFYINTDFRFDIPISEIKRILDVEGVNRVYFKLTVDQPSGSFYIYGSRFSNSVSGRRDIYLGIQENRITALSSTLANENLEFMETPTGITDQATSARVQANSAAFIGTNSVRYIRKTIGRTHFIFRETNVEEPYDYLYYDPGRNYEIITPNSGDKFMQDIGINAGGYYGYYYYAVRISLDGDSTFVENGGNTVGYIPALWGFPTEGVITYIQKKDQKCTENINCRYLGPGTTCPIKDTSDPEDSECCKSICSIPANASSFYCTSTTKCKATPPPACPAYPSCTAIYGLTQNTNCPINTGCCNTICAIPANRTSAYCTNMCRTPPPVTECTEDPQKCYCQSHGDDTATCDVYKEKDDSTTRKDECSTTDTVDDFKYPTRGYGDNKFSNEACRISCEEVVKMTFQPNKSVRAGMGYAYPVQINGTRYCTAQYKNRTWSISIVTAGSKANTEYEAMVDDLQSARDADNRCGVQQPVDAGTTCTAGESLTSDGRCKASISFNSCPSSSSSTNLSQVTTTCSANGASCDCTTITRTRTITGQTCRIISGRRVCIPIYSPWSTSTNNFSTSRCSGSYENGSCYSYRGACPARSSWNGSKCIKIMCSNNLSVYFDDAQVPILSSINAANAHRTAYNTAVNTFNSLMRDRTTCDNYASTNQYNGSENITTSYKEKGGAIQVSTQRALTRTSSPVVNSTSIGSRSAETKDIMKDRSKTLSITSTGYNRGTIGSYSGSYSDFYNATATYYDYWNEKATATNSLLFSKTYYIQRYTGELSTTSKPGYEFGGRLVYTDFYQEAKVQRFTLGFKWIGPNLPLSTGNTMKINSSNTFNCTYTVTNLIFPPEGDATHASYGNVAFDFRQVSLTNPFPGRSPRENWRGQQNLITSRGYEVYNTNNPMYEYYLDPTRMGNIRAYNRTHNYGSYDISNPYNSIFLDEYGSSW